MQKGPSNQILLTVKMLHFFITTFLSHKKNDEGMKELYITPPPHTHTRARAHAQKL
jgi:hypothetical protein